jgi:hypothetical protein
VENHKVKHRLSKEYSFYPCSSLTREGCKNQTKEMHPNFSSVFLNSTVTQFLSLNNTNHCLKVKTFWPKGFGCDNRTFKTYQDGLEIFAI